MTKGQLAVTFDHAVLQPDFTDEDLQKHANMCIRKLLILIIRKNTAYL